MAAVPLTMSIDKESQDNIEAKEGHLAPVATLGDGSEEFLFYIYVGEFSEFSITMVDDSASQAVTGKVRACNEATIDLTLANNRAPQLGGDLVIGNSKLTGKAETYVGNYKYIFITASHAAGAVADHIAVDFHGKMKGGA